MDKNIRRGLQGIALLGIVVLFNGSLYLAVEFLRVRTKYLSNTSVFPPLLLFLSFALSVGILLITGLGEKITPTKSGGNVSAGSTTDKDWIHKIGVTPIMTIVAVIIAMLAGFSQFGTMILPPVFHLKFMRADIAIRCLTKKANPPQATDLIALLSGEQDYVKDVIDFLLTAPQASEGDVSYHLRWIHPRVKMHPDDKGYDLDWTHIRNALHEPLYALLQADTALNDEMSNDGKWVAYSVDIKAANKDTSLPVPATYERDHTLHLFAALSEPPKKRQPELGTLGNPIRPSQPPLQEQQRLLSLLQVVINPHKPQERSQLTNFGVKIFADTGCWNLGL